MGATALPVELSAFSAGAFNAGATGPGIKLQWEQLQWEEMQWETVSATNNAGVEVQRAPGGPSDTE